MSLSKSRLVLRSSEFRRIYQAGIRMTSRYFTAFCLRSANPIAVSRFGFTVPRALGNAVERNRIKRRMREAVRNQFGAIPTSWDVVFNPRRNVLDASFEELCREIGRIFMQCKQL